MDFDLNIFLRVGKLDKVVKKFKKLHVKFLSWNFMFVPIIVKIIKFHLQPCHCVSEIFCILLKLLFFLNLHLNTGANLACNMSAYCCVAHMSYFGDNQASLGNSAT